jgi:hypothetical protein
MSKTLLIALLGLFIGFIPAGAAPQGHAGKDALACDLCHMCPDPSMADPCLKACPRVATEQKALDVGPEICMINELEYEYEPVIFQHRIHASMSVLHKGCTDCHHYEPAAGRISSCNQCHSRTVVQEQLSQPGLKGAYHRQCLGCHKEWSGEANCEACHAKKNQPGEPSVLRTPERFYPTIQQPEKKVWESAYGGGTKVTLHHRTHTEKYGIECSSCHHAEGCKSCHRRGETTMTVRHSEEALHAICNSCHAEMSCKQCHLKEEAAEFTHDRTGWPLNRYHKNLACRSCHGNPYHFSKPVASCNGCHASWSAATFNHGKTGLALNETHRDFECTECHVDRNFAVPPTCSNCHESGVAFPSKLPGDRVNRKS